MGKMKTGRSVTMEALSFKGKDIISINDMNLDEIRNILSVADRLEQKSREELMAYAPSKILANLFYEPSTRTRLSFEAAMTFLGGRVIGFSSAEGSSVQKGESLWDTISTVSQYSDVIVLRHPDDGAARLASEASHVPVINAGDGSNQHPTQTLLDLYSIQKIHSTIEGTSIGIVGDLKYGRTVHSLTSALSKFKSISMHFVSPQSLRIPMHIERELKESSTVYSEHERIEEIIEKVDILYMTRIQQERFPEPAEYEKVKEIYHLDLALLEKAKRHMKVLHPLPRVTEISRDVDGTEYAYYFRQAGNGVIVRQALLGLVMGVLH